MKLYLPLVFSIVLGLGVTLQAQQPKQSPPTPQQKGQGQADRDPGPAAQKVSITGCLAKASQDGQYTLTDQQSQQKVTFPAPPQLEKYVNQKVTLTGSMMTRDNGEKVFQPESVATVATSC